MTWLLDAGTGWLLFASLATALGAVSTHFLVLPHGGEGFQERRDGLNRSLASLGLAAAAGVTLALLLASARQILEFRDPFAPLGEDVALLMGSAWGSAWKAGVAMACASVVGFWMARGGRSWAWWMAAAGALGAAAYPGLTGHAAGGEGTLRFVLLSADLLHVVAAGTWLGGLASLLWLERRRPAADAMSAAASLLPSLVPAFSPVAMVSVATLVVTGSLASWAHLESVSSLWTTPYGRLLLLKVVVVAGVLVVGALNWRRLTPRLSEPDGPGAMRRSALVELALANVVLVVTAILVRTSPLGH